MLRWAASGRGPGRGRSPGLGELGPALAALLVGALTVNRLHCRVRAARGADGKPEEAKLAVREIPPR